MSNEKKLITDLIESELNDSGAYLVELKILPGNKVQVFIDHESNINIVMCAKLNRFLRNSFDEANLFNGNYAIEVSSPGLDQPLKLLKQYTKNIGKKVSVNLLDGSQKEGVLIEADEHKIVLKEESKKEEVQEASFPFSDIKSTKIAIAFK